MKWPRWAGRRTVALSVLLLLHAACAASRQPGAGQPAPGAQVPEPTSLVAEAIVPSVDVFDQPGEPEPVHRLPHSQHAGAPTVLLVEEDRGAWLRVLLPVRPNGSSGWVRRGDVKLSRHRYRVVVELGAHRITVYDGASVFHEESVGVGAQDTPTPNGRYYTTQLVRPTDAEGQPLPDGPYGPYAYVLSGFSDVLFDFEGGEGIIGIHGTNEPASLGRDTSYGCIRLSNEGMTKLAAALPLGVPVDIRA